jgi:hypothetical protein
VYNIVSIITSFFTNLLHVFLEAKKRKKEKKKKKKRVQKMKMVQELCLIKKAVYSGIDGYNDRCK